MYKLYSTKAGITTGKSLKAIRAETACYCVQASVILAACQEHAARLRRKLYRTADCATRRGNNFRRRKINLCDTLMAKIGSPEQREEHF
jgi:hypothetical protein